MKNAGIYTRLLLTLVLIGTISLLILSTIYFIANKQERLMLDASKSQFDNEIKSLIILKNSNLKQLVYDYSYWDELVKNISSGNQAWYDENIASILKSYRFDYVCVYDTNFKILHQSASDGFSGEGLVSKAILAKVKAARFLDYFQATPEGVVALSCATVHPSNDPSHTLTKPSGYLFLAKKYDQTLLDELSVLCGASIIHLHQKDTVFKPAPFTVSILHELKAWDGKTAARFIFARQANSLKVYHDMSVIMVVILLGLILVSGIVFRIAIQKWIMKPLHLVSEILQSDDPVQIAKLQQAPGEFRDIGKLFGDFFKQRDELKRAKEKAEESDKLKTAFLSNVSHEIRTPMNGILGFAGLLNAPDLTGPEQQEFIEIIKISGDRMLNIINDIVDLSKIEAGLINVSNTNSDINQQTAYINNFFKLQAQAKGLEFSCKNGLPSNQATICTDHEKIYAILTNLVKNAIKFSENGSIEFGYVVKRTTTKAQGGGNDPLQLFLEFYVRDTGIGIPVNRQEAIFDRFVQADISDTRAFQGAGLGLSISKAYVEMLGGKIWVESTEDVGSTFYFTIPYHPNPTQNEVKDILIIPQSIKTQPKQLKILVAEDDPTSGMLINIALKDFGKQIIEVNSGADAVEVCRQNPDIDLIMMDVKMTGMDGYQATKEIRKFNKKVVIIAQTAYAMINENEIAIEAGCTDFITKPLNLNLLKGLVQKYFEK
jgi:signal transduction histidine kinase